MPRTATVSTTTTTTTITANTAPASSSLSSCLSDFQPEELFGQLKAEQQSRNYVMAIKFIDTVLGLQLDPNTLKDSLRDGVVLCKLINALRPGAISRINTRNLPFTQMENIGNFLAAAQKLGLSSSDLFQTVDLYEGKNIPRVIMTLLTIARVVAGIPLNSHRKLSDGWNSITLASRDEDRSPPPLTNATPASVPCADDQVSVRNQFTLVNGDRRVAPQSPDTVTSVVNSRKSPSTFHSSASTPPGSAKWLPQYGSRKVQQRLQQERRRSKRRSATTLFISGKANAKLKAAASAVPAESDGINDPLPSTPVALETLRSDSNQSEEHPELPLAARPRKRAGTKSRPKERLTVYSESDKRLANYQLGNCIGKGQFGSVYRALDLETGEMVAVKQIGLDGQDEDDMEDVMQEVELLKSLSNPRIVRYHGFVKTESHLSLVMEFVENGSLSATLKSFGSFPEKLVLAYTVKIIEGLMYLHRRDVVHCDLKACNILTTKQGNTKLTDFGVSLNLRLRKADEESVVAGTPYWMAPEIIQLEGACMASDIWSLGCTIIELLTGKPPYSGMLQMAALYRIVEDDHPPIPEGISEELKDFLLQCFHKDPKKRPTAEKLMGHSWTAQYRRNRREMKMLRRTCSRKMSSYMARKQEDNSYPSFNAALLAPIVKEVAAAASTSASPSADQESELARDAIEESVGESENEDTGDSEEITTVDSQKQQLVQPNAAPSGDTDSELSTFEGPRIKKHRLQTIIGDGVSLCAVCGRGLSGVLIQCSACKTRCHDGCKQQLSPCTALRMSRFLFPSSRKSSKRYESKSSNLKLRAAHRKSSKRWTSIEAEHSYSKSTTTAGMDSGWETDNASTGQRAGAETRNALLVSGIRIPKTRNNVGPHSAPVDLSDNEDDSQQLHQPLYYQALAANASPPLHTPRTRASTASLEGIGSGLSTLLRRRQHPLQGATTSDFQAVAGFSPGAAQRAKLAHNGSSASISDLQSVNSSDTLGMRNDSTAQCFGKPGKQIGGGSNRRSYLKRSSKDCVIM